jgi:hypothetical protein
MHELSLAPGSRAAPARIVQIGGQSWRLKDKLKTGQVPR